MMMGGCMYALPLGGDWRWRRRCRVGSTCLPSVEGEANASCRPSALEPEYEAIGITLIILLQGKPLSLSRSL
jgi:hypothetical protein